MTRTLATEQHPRASHVAAVRRCRGSIGEVGMVGHDPLGMGMSSMPVTVRTAGRQLPHCREGKRPALWCGSDDPCAVGERAQFRRGGAMLPVKQPGDEFACALIEADKLRAEPFSGE